MPKTVLVVDGAAAFRRGIGTTLDGAGYEVEEIRSLDEWRGEWFPDVLMMTVPAAAELAAIAAFRSADSPRLVVALLPHRDEELIASMLRSGIGCVVDRDADPEVMVDAVRIGLTGHSVVPAWAARALAARVPSRPSSEQWIRDDEVEWLRMLANGATIAALAERVGYSQREMFRNLNELYARIQVKNRTGALLWADRHGLLKLDTDQIPG